MSRRVGALLLRYLLLIRRDYSRVVDLVYWPLIDITVWGLFTFFLWRAQFQVPNAMAMFLGGAILWNVFLRAAQDVSVSLPRRRLGALGGDGVRVAAHLRASSGSRSCWSAS